ncbi:uncharacterized protein LOC110808878 isoform X2 [Carica papaya]|uniref:uncharacterized protein LOC110808878 isoform X2 n=1 Tax=Carica papaya TaxID=3649 RepID=UPI000B8CDD01|nr:uncharacterized protein LOC110808878 isoform X2 [Carica papaya]
MIDHSCLLFKLNLVKVIILGGGGGDSAVTVISSPAVEVSWKICSANLTVAVMDLKSKSMAWVGNIYQKLETIGYDMDEIMNQSQDRVKYVENQVQNIGESVKRFYSDVVHDLLPPLVDPVKREGQVLACKKNAVVGTHTKSTMGIENDHVDAVNKQLHFKVGKTGSMENHVNPCEGADIDIGSGQIEDIPEVEKLEQVEENVKIEMSSASGVVSVILSVEEGFSGGPFLNDLADCNHKDACGSLTNVSPATSVHGTQVKSSQNVENHCGHICVSDVSNTISFETNFSVVSNEDKMVETEVDSSRSSLLNCHCKDACGSGTNVLHATSVYDAQVESSENVERHCGNGCVFDSYITIASPATDISVVPDDGKMAETEVGSSRSSLLECNHKDACGSITNDSPVASVHGMQVESSQNVEKHCDHDCVSDVSSTTASSKMNFSVVSNEEKMAEAEVDSSRSSLLNCHHKDACGSGTNVSLATSVYDTQVESSENVERHCGNGCVSDFYITIASTATDISVVPNDGKMAETEADSSRSSLLECNHKDACGSITNDSPAASVHGMQVDSSHNVEKHCDHDCVSDVSSIIASSKMSFSVVSNEKTMAETEVDSSRSSLLNCHHKDACGSGTNGSPATSICVVSSDGKMAETEADSSRSSLLDCNHKDACGSITNDSPAASVHGTQVEHSKDLDGHCNDCFSDASSTIASPGINISVISSDEKVADTEVDCSRSFSLDCNHKDACESGTNISLVPSVHGTHVESSQNVDRHCDSDCFSDGSKMIASPETNISVVSSNEKLAETEVASLGSSLLDCKHKDACESRTNVSPVTSVNGTQVESSKNVDRYSDNASSSIDSPETKFSVISCDENMAVIEVDSSRSSLLTEPYYVFTNSPETFPESTECYHNSVCISGAVLDGPSAFASFTLVPPHERKVAEMVPSRDVLSLNAIGNSSVELSPAQLKSPTSSSCIGAPSYSRNDDVDYSKLETIELSDNVNLENGCDIVGDSFLYAVSRRSQKLRSFKKKIQDAFTSRKRLEKEYEQLAIWFGDVDMGPCQDDLQNCLPSTATTNLETGNSHGHICDSDTEWELL